jgi:iron-sulfur cluster repair protein YtfE (RIC family)
MRRHPALKDLSRDHYFALVQAQRVRKMAEGDGDALSEKEVLEGLLDYWRTEGRLHVREEEEIVLPRLKQHSAGTKLVARALDDHRWLRDAFDDLERMRDEGEPLRDRLVETGARLAAHARHEEDTVFPQLQKTLDSRELDRLRRDSRTFRMANRGRDAIGPRHEAKIDGGTQRDPTS